MRMAARAAAATHDAMRSEGYQFSNQDGHVKSARGLLNPFPPVNIYAWW